MSFLAGLYSPSADKLYEAEYGRYLCDETGENLKVVYDYEMIADTIDMESSFHREGEQGIERYIDLLPLESSQNLPPLLVGETPMVEAPRLWAKYDHPNLHLKDDSRLPSASFKDRASAVAIAHARENDQNLITGASTGNAASSLACLTASMGMTSVIFVPASAPEGKIAQLLLYGANVFAVEGSYDDAFDLCTEVADEFDWYNRNTGYNPYTREGKKTVAFEIVLDLGHAPDYVFVSVGDGNIISGTYKGFDELETLGWIDEMPKIIGVQSENSNAIAKAFREHNDIESVHADTVADSIAVDMPSDGKFALEAARDSDGDYVEVSDQDILDAQSELASMSGIFTEPASAAAFAGYQSYRNELKQDEEAVVLLTGHGLKDVDTAMESAGDPIHVEPDLGKTADQLKRLDLV
ncbi:MAG: threonine synthase [bacterium]